MALVMDDDELDESVLEEFIPDICDAELQAMRDVARTQRYIDFVTLRRARGQELLPIQRATLDALRRIERPAGGAMWPLNPTVPVLVEFAVYTRRCWDGYWPGLDEVQAFLPDVLGPSTDPGRTVWEAFADTGSDFGLHFCRPWTMEDALGVELPDPKGEWRLYITAERQRDDNLALIFQLHALCDLAAQAA
jgi:hypothetical protein